MISWLWLIPAYVAGGLMGVFLMALCFAASEDERLMGQ